MAANKPGSYFAFWDTSFAFPVLKSLLLAGVISSVVLLAAGKIYCNIHYSPASLGRTEGLMRSITEENVPC